LVEDLSYAVRGAVEQKLGAQAKYESTVSLAAALKEDLKQDIMKEVQAEIRAKIEEAESKTDDQPWTVEAKWLAEVEKDGAQAKLDARLTRMEEHISDIQLALGTLTAGLQMGTLRTRRNAREGAEPPTPSRD